MAPRLVAHRVLQTPGICSRFFSGWTFPRARRPQIPFLSQPPQMKHQVRWQTTKKSYWKSQEIRDTVYYTSYMSAFSIIGWMLYLALDQEYVERFHPSPDDWTFWTRCNYRMAAERAHPKDPNTVINWIPMLTQTLKTIDRLESPDLDGDGVVDPIPVDLPPDPSIAQRAVYPKDITAKSENWRRGYYDTLMLTAKAAEHVEGWVLDRKQRTFFSPQVVLGPSNPNPKPMPRSIYKQPLEEDCETGVLPEPSMLYEKILNTVGFTAREKVDAAMQYAAFLEYKGLPSDAMEALQRALKLTDKASSTSYKFQIPYDSDTLVIPEPATPSANHLTVLTAMATLTARNGDLEKALPILVSILRARKQLPTSRKTLHYPERMNVEKPDTLLTAQERFEKKFGPPPYPGRFPDGSSPPKRDAAERCEEAALNAYIGEIIFATGSQESGLAWTREAVDVSEEQMHNIKESPSPGVQGWIPDRKEQDDSSYRTNALKHCEECLRTGLVNWKGMVERMNQIQEEETEKKNEEQKHKWITWGARPAKVDGRWEAEIKVVEDRLKRAEKLFELTIHRPSGWLDSLIGA
ncbi:hypothetical protein MKZ38_003457 [Zalerion maritima]|uniref:MFS maltose permease n=1 Tax=Zalerion maritima TaxID=339359 RepID=A0AAD5WX28_9PEZI|nr:hypothetical protein MKZ38_003457 [Zalerion maritima]